MISLSGLRQHRKNNKEECICMRVHVLLLKDTRKCYSAVIEMVMLLVVWNQLNHESVIIKNEQIKRLAVCFVHGNSGEHNSSDEVVSSNTEMDVHAVMLPSSVLLYWSHIAGRTSMYACVRITRDQLTDIGYKMRKFMLRRKQLLQEAAVDTLGHGVNKVYFSLSRRRNMQKTYYD